MSDRTASDTETIQAPNGEEYALRPGNEMPISCPDCGSDDWWYHHLNEVLAGECTECLGTWTIGVREDE